MFNWLKSLLNWGISGIDDLWKKVIAIFQAVYSYIDSWISSVANYLGQLWTDFTNFASAVVGWINRTIVALEQWVIRIYGDVQKWVSGLFWQVLNYAVSIYRWALQYFDFLVKYIENVWNTIVNWVLHNIWDPLYSFISGIYNWVTTSGYWVFYMITHPDKLAQLIGSYLLREWINLSRKYSRAVGRWLIHTMLSAANDVGEIIASVLSAII